MDCEVEWVAYLLDKLLDKQELTRQDVAPLLAMAYFAGLISAHGELSGLKVVVKGNGMPVPQYEPGYCGGI